MGLFDKLFGGAATPSPAPFDVEGVRQQLTALATALGDLADAMDTPEAPTTNPGWLGRLRDVRGARVDVRQLAQRTQFDKDDLFDVLTTVRPVFRGTPPHGYEHLQEPNARVVQAIEDVRAAAGS